MTHSNAEPEERDLFDLPLTPPSERKVTRAPRVADSESATLDLFPQDEGAEEPERIGEEDRAPTAEVSPVEEQAAPTGGSLLRRRVLADLTDLAAATAAVAVAWVGALLMGIRPGLATWPAFAALGLVFSFLYQTIPLLFWGATPGMARQELVARAGGGERISYRQAALRWTGWLLTLGLLGLPYVLELSGRHLSDRLAGSDTLPTA